MRTYGSLAYSNNSWVMTNLPPHVSIRLKQIFPRIKKTDMGPFTFPNDDMTCADLQWFAQRYPLGMTGPDKKRLNAGRVQFEGIQAELERILTPDYVPSALTGLRDGQEIRLYQSQAIDMLFRRKALLLGDYVGLGKTYTAAGFILKTEARPAAVVVQTHLQDQWEEKLTDFTTLRVHKIKGCKPYDLPDADVYIFKYSQLRGWVDVYATAFFKTVIFDEVQELRTGDASDKGAAAYVLADNATYRMGMSATPIYGYGVEIWNIMRALDPTVLGSREDFNREWLSDDHRVKDPDALGTYLREQHVFLRRSKKDAGQSDEPPNSWSEVVESDGQALKNIEAIARQLAQKAVSGTFTERGQAGRELDMMVRQATGVGKAKSVAAYARILLEAEVPILLVGWHRDVYDIWLKELAEFNPVMYTGSETPKKKNEAKRAFLAGESNCMILSLRSGAGMDDLQYRCSTVLFGEIDWSKEIHHQVIGRLDREGQEEQVSAVFLICEDGSDPPIIDLLAVKASQSSGILDPGVVRMPTVADTTRFKALASQYLSKREMRESANEDEMAMSA